MNEQKRPDEEKDLKDEELDKVSGGVREEMRRGGGGINPERESRGPDPEIDRLK